MYYIYKPFNLTFNMRLASYAVKVNPISGACFSISLNLVIW